MEENLIQNIKTWMELDRDIEGLQKQMKELKTKKKAINENLTKMMKNNNLDCIDVTSGQIRYSKKQSKKRNQSKIFIVYYGKIL